MKFEEIVDLVEAIEEKFADLSDSQLGLVEAMLEEGMDLEFDLVHHLDYLFEFVSSYDSKNALVITENVDCGELLGVVLDSARKNSRDMQKFVAEALNEAGELEVLTESDSTAVTMLSIVTSVLTEMLGEETVEQLPAEMVFDIVEEAKLLDIDDSVENMSLSEMVVEISDVLREAINSGEIDMETEDYTGETLAEFLDDYEDTDDLLEEMSKVTKDLLSESSDKEGVRLLIKAKSATSLLESSCEGTIRQRLSCINRKAAASKKWFNKTKNATIWGSRHGGKGIETIKLDGKLKKAVNASKAAFKKRYHQNPSEDVIRFLWIPGIVKRMRKRHQHFTPDQKRLKTGQSKVK